MNDNIPHGFTVRELAKVLRVSPDKIRSWIKSGRLPAINTATDSCKKPRYVVLPHHLETFEQRQRVDVPEKTRKERKKNANFVDYYPET